MQLRGQEETIPMDDKDFPNSTILDFLLFNVFQILYIHFLSLSNLLNIQ